MPPSTTKYKYSLSFYNFIYYYSKKLLSSKNRDSSLKKELEKLFFKNLQFYIYCKAIFLYIVILIYYGSFDNASR